MTSRDQSHLGIGDAALRFLVVRRAWQAAAALLDAGEELDLELVALVSGAEGPK